MLTKRRIEENLHSMERIADSLERIAVLLDGILAATNPLNQWGTEDIDQDKVRYSYTDEEKEIVIEKLAKMGKPYKVRV